MSATDDTNDANAPHEADRPPTPEEEAKAEEAAAQVDPAASEHYEEMAELGAQLEGEGEITPKPSE